MTITIEDFVRREVLHRANTLIYDLRRIVHEVPYKLLQETSIDTEAIERLSEIAEWEEPVERHIDGMSRGDLVECLEDLDVEDYRSPAEISAASRAQVEAEGGDDDFDAYYHDWPGLTEEQLRGCLLVHLHEQDGFQEFAEDNGIEPDRDEVYEHWVVTDWLGAKLKEKGYPVEEVCGFTIWGRPTTGQHISMDWVIQKVYQEATA